MGAEDRVLEGLEQLVAAIGVSQDVTASLIEANRETNARILELADDVASLGSRLLELERRTRNEHSLTVVGREGLRTLDELAAVLRAELADEVETITERIDNVHTPALRALTALTERTHPA